MRVICRVQENLSPTTLLEQLPESAEGFEAKQVFERIKKLTSPFSPKRVVSPFLLLTILSMTPLDKQRYQQIVSFPKFLKGRCPSL